MGSCYSCNVIKNKIRPSTPTSAVPRRVTGNFLRGRGDGESDVSDTEKVAKSPPLHPLLYQGNIPPPLVYPGHLDRHVLGSSFSSSCSSQSIPDVDDHDEGQGRIGKHGEVDPLTHFYQLTAGSRLQSFSRYDMLSEVASEVKTEGGLTDVSIDLDHPFAPTCQDGGELNQSMLSRPRSVGMRGRSSYTRDMMSQMSNYTEFESPRDPAHKRLDTPVPGTRGRNSHLQSVLGKKKSSKKKANKRKAYPAQFEEDRKMKIPSGMSDSSLSVQSDDGGSSLSSSSSLSDIGELSELSSAASRRSNKPCQTNVPPKIPPKPIRREKEQSDLNKTPKSAEGFPNAKIIDPATVQARSADLLGRRENSNLYAKRPTQTPPTSYFNHPKPQSVSSAWGDRLKQWDNTGKSMVAKENCYSNHYISESSRGNPGGNAAHYERSLLRSPLSPRDTLQLTSPSPREEERPMATRLRHTGMSQMYPTPAPRPSISKRLAQLVREEVYPEDPVDAYPQLPGTLGDDKFKTIIII